MPQGEDEGWLALFVTPDPVEVRKAGVSGEAAGAAVDRRERAELRLRLLQ